MKYYLSIISLLFLATSVLGQNTKGPKSGKGINPQRVTSESNGPVAAEIAKLGEPFISWYNQGDNELPKNFNKQIQSFRERSGESPNEIKEANFELGMRSAFYKIRKQKVSVPNGAFWLITEGSLWATIKDNPLDSICANGDFEDSAIDPAQWSGGYGFIGSTNNPMLATYTSAIIPTPGTGIDASIITSCASIGTVASHANEMHQTIVRYNNDPTLGALLKTTSSPSNKYSLRIGNGMADPTTNYCKEFGTEFISKKFVVSGSGTIKFMYALVMDGIHDTDSNPSFYVKVFNSTGGLITNKVFLNPLSTLPKERVVSDSTDPFQQHFTAFNGEIVNYKDWTCATIKLDSFIGQTVSVVLLTTDCAVGGHFGYAYVDNWCGNCEGTTTGSINIKPITDSCIKKGGQVCVDYSLPKVGPITGTGSITLHFYQNGSAIPYSITSTGALPPVGPYCFTIDPAQLPCNPTSGGYDVAATGNFSVTVGSTTTPITVTSPDPIGSAPNVEGIKPGKNNDLVCCFAPADICRLVSATLVKDTDGCCYSIYLSNKYLADYFTGLTIETGHLNIDNVSQGGTWGGITYQSGHVVSFGDTVGVSNIPLDSAGSKGFFLAKICVSGIGADVLKLRWLGHGQPVDTVCEKDIAVFGCGVPVDTNCAGIINQKATCNNGVVSMQFQVTNKSGFTMRALTFYTTDPNVKPVNAFFPIADLAPGATSPVYSVPLVVKNNASSGCFYFSACDLHVLPGTGGQFPKNCCLDSIKYCFAIPACNNCDAISITSTKTDPSNCCYKLTLNNNYAGNIKCVRFNGEAGTQFSILSGWNIQAPVSSNEITMCAPGGKVNTGISPDFASFCITGTSTPPYKMSIDFLGDLGQVICTDQLQFDSCTPVKPTCANIVDDSLYCDGSRTEFSFKIKNNSTFPLYQVDLRTSDTSFKMDQSFIVPNPPIQPGTTSARYLVTIDSSSTGNNAFCMYLTGHNNVYIKDSVAATKCCTDSIGVICLPYIKCDTTTCGACCQFSNLVIPNGLTPNGDGFNSMFVIQNSAICTDIKIKVYNRWGNMVFKDDHYTNNWKGTNKDGQTLPQGTYFVVIELPNGSKHATFIDLRY